MPPPCTPPPVLFCAAHLRRTGSRVPADRVIDDEAFCRACFHGKLISPVGKSQRKNLQSFSHLSANPRPPRDSNPLSHRAPGCGTVRPRTQGPKQNRLACSTMASPSRIKLTALETKLLNALQGILLDETMMLAAIHRYRIPATGQKNTATARRGGRSRRTWQIPLQPAPIVRQVRRSPQESTA
jgi:hypothetical protein